MKWTQSGDRFLFFKDITLLFSLFVKSQVANGLTACRHPGCCFSSHGTVQLSNLFIRIQIEIN